MANSIQSAITSSHNLIIEAGTGTGKSFAYLIPAINFAIENNTRVIISTYTKTLQHQMVSKDLPFLQSIYSSRGLGFTYTVMYGSANYLCIDKFKKFLKSGKTFLFNNIENLISWVKSTETGLKNELPFYIPYEIWNQINRDTILCTREHCEYKSDCFYYKAIEQAKKSQIIVLNHHLFFYNLLTDFSLIPDAPVVIFDEAHNLEDVAVKVFSLVLNEQDIKIFIRFLENFYASLVDKHKVFSPHLLRNFREKLEEFEREFTKFFLNIKLKFNTSTRVHDTSEFKNMANLTQSFKNFVHESFTVSENLFIDEKIISQIDKIKEKVDTFFTNSAFFIQQPAEDYVYWIEIDEKFKTVSLVSSPLIVKDIFQKKIFNHYTSVILTSATLTTEGNFEYIKSRLGIDEAEEQIYPSPFDFKTQATIYINPFLSSPLNYEKYIDELSDEIVKLLSISKGRGFVLFTSFKTLKEVKNRTENKINYRLLVQGENSIKNLLKIFKEEINSVLFGTLSFWEGVDIPGEALSIVIITRLPFEVPDDPITSGRIEFIKKNGGSPFIEYQLPHAILLLKQGFGRLIRNTSDKGVVAILDSRIVNKGYGKKFLNSLPECSITYNIEDIKKFF